MHNERKKLDVISSREIYKCHKNHFKDIHYMMVYMLLQELIRSEFIMCLGYVQFLKINYSKHDYLQELLKEVSVGF